MKVLIVYEMVPESTRFYTVDVSFDDWRWMQLTHGHFINNPMNNLDAEACDKLSRYLEGKEYDSPSSPILLRGEGYDYLIHTGFIL